MLWMLRLDVTMNVDAAFAYKPSAAVCSCCRVNSFGSESFYSRNKLVLSHDKHRTACNETDRILRHERRNFYFLPQKSFYCSLMVDIIISNLFKWKLCWERREMRSKVSIRFGNWRDERAIIRKVFEKMIWTWVIDWRKRLNEKKNIKL